MLSASDRERLRVGAQKLDVALTDEHERKLALYVERLLVWNQKFNMTTVTDPTAIVDKHLLDALAVVPVVRDHVRPGTTLVDVGTGPGLPSVVLAVLFPTLAVSAVESIQKKATFVRTIARELGAPIDVRAVRLENLDPGARFDIAVSRATFEPTEWVERGSVLVNPAGMLVAMLSEQQPVPQPPPGFRSRPLVSHIIGGATRRIASYLRD